MLPYSQSSSDESDVVDTEQVDQPLTEEEADHQRAIHLTNLAHFLVSVRDEPILTIDHIRRIRELCGQLDERDRQRTVYGPIFKGKLSTGRFQVAKGQNVSPGKELCQRLVDISHKYQYK